MIDNRAASAINQALQKHDTPVGHVIFCNTPRKNEKNASLEKRQFVTWPSL